MTGSRLNSFAIFSARSIDGTKNADGLYTARVEDIRVEERGPLRAVVRRNGAIAAETRGGHRLGDPSVLLPWFVEHVAARGRALAAGDLVTAGTWAGVVTAAPGDAIDVEFEGVGRASATFG